mmetsp:Transcript_41465/g.120068  ORF Transcript_41465/g.120068 Transcript_41465/m.120068 type:complete len:228 (-) Transcript_41465:66-749(-)
MSLRLSSPKAYRVAAAAAASTAGLVGLSLQRRQGLAMSAAPVRSNSSAPLSRPVSAFWVLRVEPDGRCLFRAIAAGVALSSGGNADSAGSADSTAGRRLVAAASNVESADKLRAAVVAELLRRREEVEWFLEEPFDKYVAKMSMPSTWGGEPELLMASHLLGHKLWVWMPGELVDPSKFAGRLVRSASYGDDLGDKTIVHLRYSGAHYDLLVPLTGPGADATPLSRL